MLECDDVKRMLAAAENEAVHNQWAVTIAVVDDGGHLLGLLRLDGAPTTSVQVAPAKAGLAALGGRESRFYEDLIHSGRLAYLSVPGIQGALEDGVPIKKDGQCMGAIGVSGAKSGDDAQIAKAGLAALGI